MTFLAILKLSPDYSTEMANITLSPVPNQTSCENINPGSVFVQAIGFSSCERRKKHLLIGLLSQECAVSVLIEGIIRMTPSPPSILSERNHTWCLLVGAPTSSSNSGDACPPQGACSAVVIQIPRRIGGPGVMTWV